MLLKWGFLHFCCAISLVNAPFVPSSLRTNSIIAFLHKMMIPMVYDRNFEHRVKTRTINNSNNMHVKFCWKDLLTGISFFRSRALLWENRRSACKTLLGLDECFPFSPAEGDDEFLSFTLLCFSHFSFMTRANNKDKAEMINGQFIRDILMTLHTVELAKIMKAENNVLKDGWTACVTQTGKHCAFETAEVSFG